MVGSCVCAGPGVGLRVLPVVGGVAMGVLVAKPLISWVVPRVVAAGKRVRARLLGEGTGTVSRVRPLMSGRTAAPAPAPQQGAAAALAPAFRRFLEGLAAKKKQEPLATALANGSHVWVFSEEPMTATLGGAQILFGKATCLFDLFKKFASYGCRATSGDLLPSLNLSDAALSRAVHRLHQYVSRLSARFEKQLGYEISSEWNGKVFIYSLRPVGVWNSRRRLSRAATGC